MKKSIIISLLTLSFGLMMTSCKSDKPADSVSTPVLKPIIEDTSGETTVDTPIQNTDEDLPPEPGMVRSRLTNEWVSEEQNSLRPVALMIPNSSTASQFGISEADILYECNVEGSMTRLMAIIDNWQDYDKLGNIRSCRDYFVYWAFEWDSIYIHYGGPFYINDIISRDDTQNINCIDFSDGTFRDETAKNTTDDAFTSAARIKKGMDHYGYQTTYRPGYADDHHYVFAPFNAPNDLSAYGEKAFTATNIDMSKAYPVTNCYFKYNEDTGLYDRFQRLSGGSDGPHIDLMNDEQLSFANVIVQNTYHEVRDQKGYLAFQCHDTTRDGWYFTKGKGIHVNWKKESDYGSTRYYDDAGNEVLFNTGKTMVLIIEDGDTVMVNDEAFSSGNTY